MKNWSDVVGSVVFEQQGLTKAVLELGRSTDRCEVRVDLVGRAGPGLVDRTIVWKRETAPAAHGEPRLELPMQGVLIEATALGGKQGAAARIIWFDEEGENRLELSGFTCEVEKGPPVLPDDRSTVARRAEIVTGVREWLARWREAPGRDAPRMSELERLRAAEGRSDDERTLVDALGECDYALRGEAAPCPHMRIPHLYSWLTSDAIPRGTTGRRLPEGLLPSFPRRRELPRVRDRSSARNGGRGVLIGERESSGPSRDSGSVSIGSPAPWSERGGRVRAALPAQGARAALRAPANTPASTLLTGGGALRRPRSPSSDLSS
jgi:hypothetical protein